MDRRTLIVVVLVASGILVAANLYLTDGFENETTNTGVVQEEEANTLILGATVEVEELPAKPATDGNLSITLEASVETR